MVLNSQAKYMDMLSKVNTKQLACSPFCPAMVTTADKSRGKFAGEESEKKGITVEGRTGEKDM